MNCPTSIAGLLENKSCPGVVAVSPASNISIQPLASAEARLKIVPEFNLVLV